MLWSINYKGIHGHAYPCIPHSYPILFISNFAIAIAAVDRFVTSRLERNFCFFSALGAYCRIHLAAVTEVTGTESLCFSCLATGKASFGFIGVTFGLEEFLFFPTECESLPTIRARKGLILKTHRMTSY
jgi:hypothetical protein